jgi:tRNA1(Val) A37 N6-methylase TrmN6
MSLDQPTDFVKQQTLTHDAFLGGRLTLSQPRDGFRAGLDSVLLGAAVPEGKGRLLDLGAGVGTAGLVALALGLAGNADLAERDEPTAALAAQNIVANGFSEVARSILVDITDAPMRRSAGLPGNAFDVVIANPPYFAAGRGTRARKPDRADARHMEAEALDSWVRAAAASARAGGLAIFVYPADALGTLLPAFEARFGAISVLPLAPRPAAPASRLLIRGIKGSRAPLTLMATRALHPAETNGFAPEFDAILRGKSALVW